MNDLLKIEASLLKGMVIHLHESQVISTVAYPRESGDENSKQLGDIFECFE